MVMNEIPMNHWMINTEWWEDSPRQATLSQWWNASDSFSSSATVKPVVSSRGLSRKKTRVLKLQTFTVTLGKRLRNYGKSPFCSWVNPLFRLGHVQCVITVESPLESSWIHPKMRTNSAPNKSAPIIPWHLHRIDKLQGNESGQGHGRSHVA